MNYEDMSDFEINKLVAKKVFNSHEWVCVNSWSDGEFIASLVNYTQEKFDPCNNPSDAWPIIVENKISISHSIALYRADALVYDEKFNKGFKIFKQDSPLGDTSSSGALRAAMICFLKMKDAEK